MAKEVRPGATTGELSRLFDSLAAEAGVRSALLGYKGFPASVAFSTSNVVCRALPSDAHVLHEGEIVGIDIALEQNELYVDTATTVPVGAIAPNTNDLLRSALEALRLSVAAVRPGVAINAVAEASSRALMETAFCIADGLSGHGTGVALHCEPDIPHSLTRKSTDVFVAGMAVALEPVVLEFQSHLRVSADGWAIEAIAGPRSAFFEHTVLITDEGPKVITGSQHAGQWEPPGAVITV